MGSVGTFSPTNWLKVHGQKTVKLHFGYRYVLRKGKGEGGGWGVGGGGGGTVQEWGGGGGGGWDGGGSGIDLLIVLRFCQNRHCREAEE